MVRKMQKRRRGFRTVFLGSESFAKTFVKVIDNGLLQWKHEGLGEVNIFNKTSINTKCYFRYYLWG